MYTKFKNELIAPAGNLKKLKYAIEYGADAVYLGIPDFSLRARINDFDLQSIKEGVDYAHSRQRKVYVTINIFAHNQHLEKLPTYVKKLKEYKIDALIISDPGIIAVVKKIWPKAKIHMSTQANVTNWQAAKFWYSQGIKRIVLARECTLEEVAEIHRRVPKLELEYFAHGAMCMSYSGRCILSKYMTDKSANLGECTQPCRWEYNIYLEEIKRKGEYMKYEEDQHGTYILNSKDLCLINHLDEMKKAGITSFKIEGRAKSIYYLSTVIKNYKQAFEILEDKKIVNKKSAINKLFKELEKTTNRGFSNGFLFGKETFENKIESSQSESDWIFVGEIIKVEKKGSLYYTDIETHNSLKKGDKVEVVQPKGDNLKIVIGKMLNVDNLEEVSESHGGNGLIVRVVLKQKLEVMSLLRKKK